MGTTHCSPSIQQYEADCLDAGTLDSSLLIHPSSLCLGEIQLSEAGLGSQLCRQMNRRPSARHLTEDLM
ncbi:hypothetical protein GDO81_013395 [Engystomops pustulosus]|uniref:Uncharacterized protein n=1 Tax=Engystomops pustulosus TaxID=76066 RepID=A0AAV7B4C5_ENGPU|nr:hypothetical protein GDO81_013395 [Engystomops pustulosus]